MGISRYQAYTVLNLPVGACEEAIDRKFCQLARHLCPAESPIFIPRFKKLVWAYQKLKIGVEDTSMSLEQMMNLTVLVFQGEDPFVATGDDDDDDDYSDDDDYDDDDDDDVWVDEEDMMPASNNILERLTAYIINQRTNSGVHSSPRSHLPLTSEANARELVAQEEMEKSKAAKKRAKKKRQREKKRQEKLAAAGVTATDVVDEDDDKKEEDDVNNNEMNQPEAPEVDESSAFISAMLHKVPGCTSAAREAKQRRKLEKRERQKRRRQDKLEHEQLLKEQQDNQQEDRENQQQNQQQKQRQQQDRETSEEEEEQEEEDEEETSSVTLRATQKQARKSLKIESRKLAIEANALVTSAQYAEAAILFTKAIDLQKNDFRFFGNRSFCFEQLEEYDRALQDADMAIILSADWPNAHFRRGRALAGLKLYANAKQSFEKVLELQSDAEDAMVELDKLRVQQIMDMGFCEHDAITALNEAGSVQDAINNLLAEALDDCEVSRSTSTSSCSKTSEHTFVTKLKAAPVVKTKSFASIAKTNTRDDGVKSIWVGNMEPHISTTKLLDLFSKCGTITSVHRPQKQRYAFINYTTSAAVEQAFFELQGVELEGVRLRLKVPDNVQTSAEKSNGTAAPSLQKPEPSAPASGSNTMRDDECYFWRTTGCAFGAKCYKTHIEKNKGIDFCRR